MKTKTLPYFIICPILYALITATGCNKQNEFLNAKPNQSLVVPESLSDYQALLDNTNIFNLGIDPALGELSSDDFYVLPSILNVRTDIERNTYLWAPTVYDAGQTPSDWSGPYQQVYYANTVLDGLSNIKIPPDQQKTCNQIEGSALFFRSYAFYNLVQTFALPFDPSTANTDLGIPLRLTADVTIKSVRATEQACYNQVINDLKKALPLLPAKSLYPTAPSQPAANALLARIYLAIGDYADALKYSNSCLAEYQTLVDYNTLTSPTTTAINSTIIAEDIYHASMVNYSMIAVRRNSVVDSVLYASYADNDLRKTKFFTILDNLPQYPRFVGSYDFEGNKYDGLATDEIFLIRAECYAREGNAEAAMKDLNTLLLTRWKTGTFIPYTASSATDALNQILIERRKELVYRGLRWTDLRRLNKDNQFKITLVRNVNGTIYTLAPNDPKYALPIPDAEISISGLIQNPR
jgi:tetratricopeptide (TPR) repeat protein